MKTRYKMNTLVITIGDATYNFIVAPGTPINIQLNPIVELLPPVLLPPVEEEEEEKPVAKLVTKLVTKPVTKLVTKLVAVRHKYQKDATGNYICPYGCGATKKNLNTMSEHVRATHSSEYGRDAKLHKCIDCGDGFSTKTKLQHHVSNHHAINYVKCPYPECAYDKAKNASTIVQHYARHHMDHRTMYTMSDNMCICNGCGTSSSKVGILYHLGICNNLSPFCKSCDPVEKPLDKKPLDKKSPSPNEKIMCECGCLVISRTMARHCETKKHITLVEKNKQTK